MGDPADEIPETLTIHYPLILVAKELVESAMCMEDRGDPASVSGARARCATAIFLACAALEACTNIVAGLHYSTGRGRADALEAGWPVCPKTGERWHRKSTPAKWRDMTRLVPDGHFPMVLSRVLEDVAQSAPDCSVSRRLDWHTEMTKLFSGRNEIIAHFKGSWGAAGTEDAYNSLNTCIAMGWSLFAIRMIRGLHEGYQQKYGYALSYGPKEEPGSAEAPRGQD